MVRNQPMDLPHIQSYLLVGSDATMTCLPITLADRSSGLTLSSVSSPDPGYLRLSAIPAVVDVYKVGGCEVGWFLKRMASNFWPSAADDVCEPCVFLLRARERTGAEVQGTSASVILELLGLENGFLDLEYGLDSRE